jgi:hypothetical protein
MLKRLVVWLLEMSAEVLLLCLFLIVFSYFSIGGTSDISARTVWFSILGISILFMVKTGYLLTMAIVRILWTNQKPWLHPAISVILFQFTFSSFSL